PFTKPAKVAGDKIILIGETANDGNDTLFRAGLVPEMRPAEALFEEERTTLEACLAAFQTGKIHACSDLGAAGIGAAVCESARYGGFGAKVDLSAVPVKVEGLTAEEILICETQARMVLQVSPADADEIMGAIQSKNGIAAMIGEITNDDKEVFEYRGQIIATIPNKPSKEDDKGQLFKLLAKKGATMMTEVKYEEITDKGLAIITKDGKRETLEADTIVLAMPLQPNTDLIKSLDGEVPEVYPIGDCREPRLIADAIADGSRIAYTI
ncbi:unnamed protein product, partial [marine sediment metagenome]